METVPTPVSVDLTGLPAPVVQLVRQIVQDARAGLGVRGTPIGVPVFLSRPQLTPEEFEQKLREMAAMGLGGKSLPADFSRADVYDDHD